MAYSISNDEAEQMAAMWKNEAEIAQAKVKELEQQLKEAQYKVKTLGLFSVVGQSEQLKRFYLWIDENYGNGMLSAEVGCIVDEYEKTL